MDDITVTESVEVETPGSTAEPSMAESSSSSKKKTRTAPPLTRQDGLDVLSSALMVAIRAGVEIHMMSDSPDSPVLILMLNNTRLEKSGDVGRLVAV